MANHTQNLLGVPKRRITEAEKEIVYLKLERARLRREKATLILNHGIYLFLAFIAVGVLLGNNNVLNTATLNVIFLFAVVCLFISIVPYMRIMHREEKQLDATIEAMTRDPTEIPEME